MTLPMYKRFYEFSYLTGSEIDRWRAFLYVDCYDGSFPVVMLQQKQLKKMIINQVDGLLLP